MNSANRLKKSCSFTYIQKKGDALSNDFLRLATVKASSIKVGICVSKKVGNSVVRSKVKRRISEAFRLRLHLVDQNRNYVIIAKDSCAHATYKDIDTALFQLLERKKYIIKAAI